MARVSVLVSACLLGAHCRYDGKAKQAEGLAELMALAELVPVCPEQLGGLETPRLPAERLGARVLARDGRDVTGAFFRGAEESARLAQLFDVRFALFKERSPSCGAGEIYDGSFTGTRVPGDGVTAERLRAEGIRVYGESRIAELIAAIKACADCGGFCETNKDE